ncbi:hypothetical protein [Streptomyces sp. NPDC048606]|uniref:hypothetical protein n=1 Tax=Streptomyces sp. NPDC048606 TaxID=3154726 RepID=UPI003431584A
MAGEQQHVRETVAPRAGHERYTCPACGRAVDTVVSRRKSLGIFVPDWHAGPCHNPECHRYLAPEGVGRVPSGEGA